MCILQIDIPERVKAVMDEQIRTGGFPSPSDYFCRLVEEDALRREKAATESLLVRRVEDDRVVVMDSADWANMRQEFERRVAGRGAQ